MSKQILISVMVITTMLAASCTQPVPTQHASLATASATDSFSRYIPMDTANKMISSYLGSINYTQNDTDVRSFSINAKQLRKYLDSMSTSNTIVGVKVFFAHTLSYVNSRGANHFAGYNSGKLTLIIAAFDSSGNYVYYNVNTVMDYSSPCPPSCASGNAGGALLTD